MTEAARPPAGPTVGVDIGGTKVAVGLVGAGGAVLRAGRIPTPRTGAEGILSAVAEMVRRVAGRDVPLAVGVGAPGVIDPGSGAVTAATEVVPGWTGAPVREYLSRALQVPVAVDNDVRAMAFGEARAGAGRGYPSALFVSVGTGIGGALLLDGRLRHGSHGTAGEIAHLLAGRTGPIRCGCGRDDHVEAVCSGPAIHAGGAGVGEAAEVLGRSLSGLVTALDVDAVIVGGGVAQSGAAFLKPFARALRAEVLPPLREIPVLPAELGLDAPIIGAALLAADLIAGGTA